MGGDDDDDDDGGGGVHDGDGACDAVDNDDDINDSHVARFCKPLRTCDSHIAQTC